MNIHCNQNSDIVVLLSNVYIIFPIQISNRYRFMNLTCDMQIIKMPLIFYSLFMLLVLSHFLPASVVALPVPYVSDCDE